MSLFLLQFLLIEFRFFFIPKFFTASRTPPLTSALLLRQSSLYPSTDIHPFRGNPQGERSSTEDFFPRNVDEGLWMGKVAELVEEAVRGGVREGKK